MESTSPVGAAMEYFTRRETVVLTRTSRGRLAYLAKTGMVVPVYLQNDRRQLYYSWEQILELRTIASLRRQVSLQMIRQIITFLEALGIDRALHNKHLVVENNQIDWVQASKDCAAIVVQVAAPACHHVGQLRLPTLPTASSFSRPASDAGKVVELANFRQRSL